MDIIVIQLPDPMIKYNNEIHNDYNIKTYMFSQAITPDYSICCFHSDISYPEFAQTLSDTL